MITVGIRLLKTQLSRYVARVVSGESIIISDRGRPVAMLCPLPAAVEAMETLRSQGTIHWSGRKPSFGPKKHWKEGKADPGAAGAVIEDRR